MLRSITILALVFIMLVSTAAPAGAESRGLFLPALGRNYTQFGTVAGTAVCSSGIVPSGVWLWLGDYSTVTYRNGTFVAMAPAGQVAPITYSGYAVTAPITMTAGRQYIGLVVLPC